MLGAGRITSNAFLVVGFGNLSHQRSNFGFILMVNIMVSL
jgi:hypothetical protein